MRKLIFSLSLLFFVSATLKSQDEAEKMKNLIKSSKSKERLEGLTLLSQYSGMDRFMLAAPLMADPKTEIREKALDIIGEKPHDEAVPLLNKARNDVDKGIRRKALNYLLAYSTGTFHFLLESLEKEKDDEIRMDLLDGLAQKGTGVLEFLSVSLRDGSREIRKKALFEADKRSGKNILGLFKEYFRQEKERSLEELALDVISKIKEKESVPLLIYPATEDQDVVIRAKALTILSMMEFPEALTALSKGVKDPSKEIRLLVVNILSAGGDQSVIGALKAALKDREFEIRRRAVYAPNQP